MVQELYLDLGPEVAAHGIGGNFVEIFVSIFPHLLSGNAVENFQWVGKVPGDTCQELNPARLRWSLGRWLPDGFRGRAAAMTPFSV